MAAKQKSTPKNARQPARPARRPTSKKPARKPAAKKAAKKAPPRKPARKTPAKKAPAKKAPAKKATAKKAPAPKKPLKKAVAKPAKKPAGPLPARKLPPPPPPPSIRQAKPLRPFRKDELAYFRTQLQKQLELIQNNLNALASDNLKRSPIESSGDISAHSTHMADQGTDNFDRELALNLASSRQDSLYDVEDAIRRIDEGTYGACEVCGRGIERARLKALPFAKKCMGCQNASERGRTLYRPFSGTLPLQQLAAEDAAAEPPDTLG